MDFDEIDTRVDVYLIIKSLVEEKLISLKDLDFLDLYISGYSFREIANISGADRDTISASIPNSMAIIKQRYENEILCNM